MKITESKLRQMIRGVIREFTGSGTAMGAAEKKGFKSTDTKSKEDSFNKAKSNWETKAAAVDTSKRYKSTSKSGRDRYTDDVATIRGPGYGPWITNPDYTSQVADRDAAEANKDSAEATRDAAREADLKKTVPKQKQQTGGGAGFGKGKSGGKAGKGKGKGKKRD